MSSGYVPLVSAEYAGAMMPDRKAFAHNHAEARAALDRAVEYARSAGEQSASRAVADRMPIGLLRPLTRDDAEALCRTGWALAVCEEAWGWARPGLVNPVIRSTFGWILSDLSQVALQASALVYCTYYVTRVGIDPLVHMRDFPATDFEDPQMEVSKQRLRDSVGGSS